MHRDPIPAKHECLESAAVAVLQACFILIFTVASVVTLLATPHADPAHTLVVRIDAPQSDVVKAVEQVSQDQIVHGTYSYEKERILYGAHGADSARVFGVWKGPGKAFYKVADKVLSPRFFKDTGDIGTISVRYVVQEIEPGAATVQIDAIFVDARNVKHASLGEVESGEYAAIQQHLKSNRESQRELQAANSAPATQGSQLATPPLPASQPAALASDPAASSGNVEDLQKRIETLKHQVELRVKDSGAPLKSAPFRGATTLESLPGQTQVLIVVLSPYWYGVETEDGHHGWIHHSQLEPLP
jgi:hypothetical protein